MTLYTSPSIASLAPKNEAGPSVETRRNWLYAWATAIDEKKPFPFLDNNDFRAWALAQVSKVKFLREAARGAYTSDAEVLASILVKSVYDDLMRQAFDYYKRENTHYMTREMAMSVAKDLMEGKEVGQKTAQDFGAYVLHADATYDATCFQSGANYLLARLKGIDTEISVLLGIA